VFNTLLSRSTVILICFLSSHMFELNKRRWRYKICKKNISVRQGAITPFVLFDPPLDAVNEWEKSTCLPKGNENTERILPLIPWVWRPSHD